MSMLLQSKYCLIHKLTILLLVLAVSQFYQVATYGQQPITITEKTDKVLVTGIFQDKNCLLIDYITTKDVIAPHEVLFLYSNNQGKTWQSVTDEQQKPHLQKEVKMSEILIPKTEDLQIISSINQGKNWQYVTYSKRYLAHKPKTIPQKSPKKTKSIISVIPSKPKEIKIVEQIKPLQPSQQPILIKKTGNNQQLTNVTINYEVKVPSTILVKTTKETTIQKNEPPQKNEVVEQKIKKKITVVKKAPPCPLPKNKVPRSKSRKQKNHKAKETNSIETILLDPEIKDLLIPEFPLDDFQTRMEKIGKSQELPTPKKVIPSNPLQ